MSTGNNEEDLLAVVDSDVERLLVVLESKLASCTGSKRHHNLPSQCQECR